MLVPRPRTHSSCNNPGIIELTIGLPSFEKQWCLGPMYAFSCDVLRPCVRHTAKQYSKTSPHTPLSLLLGARGVSLRLSSGLCSGERQHETQCSKLSQQLSSLLHLLAAHARLQGV
jgi:hypothetical protein